MEKFLLELDQEIVESVINFLKIIPGEKVKIIKLNQSFSTDKSELYKELEEIDDPWEFMDKIAGTIDGNIDESVNHDHYIHGTPKLNGK